MIIDVFIGSASVSSAPAYCIAHNSMLMKWPVLKPMTLTRHDSRETLTACNYKFQSSSDWEQLTVAMLIVLISLIPPDAPFNNPVPHAKLSIIALVTI
jgi:hypothetical protein